MDRKNETGRKRRSTRFHFTPKGAVFITAYRIVRRRTSQMELFTGELVAEPGDLILVQNSELRNLTRAEHGLAAVRFPLDGAVFELPMAS